MKKISLLCLALSTSAALLAQSTPQLKTTMERRVFAGVKAGAHMSTVSTSNFPSTTGVSSNYKTSFHGGFLVNVPLGANTFSLQPELLYNRLGGKLNYTINVPPAPATTATYEQDLHYISLPLMLQARSANGLYVELGPQASYLIKAKAQAAGTNDSEDNKSDFDNFDVAVNGGIGYVTRVGFGVGARYSHGLSNTLEDDGSSTNNGPEMKNRAFSLSLFYLFGANK
jgi:hypothetical protein